MTPWTALLESLHSSLVAELREQDSEAIMEMGMPSRHSIWCLPSTILQSPTPWEGVGQGVDFSSSETADSVGFCGLIISAATRTQLHHASELWLKTQQRGAEAFVRKGIRPRFSPVTVLKSVESPFAATRLVWMPILWKEHRIALFLAAK